jgi:hypothetical protein
MIGGYANYFLFHKKPNQAFPKGRMFDSNNRYHPTLREDLVFKLLFCYQ